MRKISFILFFLFFIVILGSIAYIDFLKNNDFENLTPEEIRILIEKHRQIAIAKTKETGDYKCCINPPCTMCFDSANKWNYGQAGKCFCDEFIAKGQEPCPQCKKGLGCVEQSIHGSEDASFCDINLN